MEQSRELILEIKGIRAAKRINYDEILDALMVNGIPTVSKTTLRRVFADGSEDRASNFNYEKTLVPIADAIRKLDGSSPHVRQVEMLMELIAEKDKQIARLIDRLDLRDNTIAQLISELKRKDELIAKLMEKVL